MKLRLNLWKDIKPEKKLKKAWWVKWKIEIILNTKFLALKQREICALAYISSLAAEADSGTVFVVPEHLYVFGRMSSEEFSAALEILSSYEIVEVLAENRRKIGAEFSPEIPQKSSLEEKRGEERRIEEVVVREVFPTQRTYVECDAHGEPLPPKRPRRALPPAADDFLEAFKPVEEILAGRRITRELQETWLKLYTIEFLIEKIRKLKAWELTAGPKGRKQNWGKFYSNCFSKDWDSWARNLHGAKQAGAPQKSFWARQQELKEQGGGND